MGQRTLWRLEGLGGLQYLFSTCEGNHMSDVTSLKASLRRWTLILGVLQITVGCGVGFIPPSAVHWFRGIVMAHIEFTANGVLMVAFGFLTNELALGSGLLRTWFATLQIG